jgi:hypothetical protein
MSYAVTVAVDWDNDGSFTGPLTTNRIANGDFASGETYWEFGASITHSVSGGKLHAYRNGAYSYILQHMDYTVSPGDTFTVSLKVANPSGIDKVLMVHLSGYFYEWYAEGVFTIPAGASEATKTFNGTASAYSAGLMLVLYPPDDNTADLTFDDISVTTTHNKDVITAYVIDANLSAGFSDEMRHVADVGQAFFKLDNGDRRFSPAYTAGSLYGKLLPNRPVRVQATSGATTWTLWKIGRASCRERV